MKRFVCLLILFAFLTFMVPFVACFLPKEAQKQPAETTEPNMQSDTPTTPQAAGYNEAPLLILDESSGDVLSVPIKVFVMGAVAAEMPMSYPDEALKAQAVASHSYALAVKAQADPNDVSLKGAYFKANPAQRIGYITDDVMRIMWGAAYTENIQRLEKLVDEVLPNVAAYNGEAALCCYHAISNGTTESSEALWGTYVPYLVSVASPYDTSCDEYETTITMSSQEMFESLIVAFDNIQLTGEPASWFGESITDAAGYVQNIDVGGITASGASMRSALALRSASFDIKYENHEFIITARGYGHGIGMSQYGASKMAENGAKWQNIISFYFPGTEIKTAEELA